MNRQGCTGKLKLSKVSGEYRTKLLSSSVRRWQIHGLLQLTLYAAAIFVCQYIVHIYRHAIQVIVTLMEPCFGCFKTQTCMHGVVLCIFNTHTSHACTHKTTKCTYPQGCPMKGTMLVTVREARSIPTMHFL